MANLSNINNVLRVSSDLRVGINTDAASYALEIGGTNSGIKLKNSGGSGKVYSLLSDTSGNFQIYDDAAASGRLVISSAGNATFAGDINVLGEDINFATGGFADINNSGTGAIRLRPSGTTTALTLNATNSTFAGSLIANNYISIKTASSSGSPYIDFLQNTTQKAYIQFNDGANALNFQSDNAFTFIGGSVERVRIDGVGNVGIGTTSPLTPLMVNRASNSDEPGIYYDVTGGSSGSVGIGATAAIGPFIVGNTLPNGNVRGAYSASRMLFNGGGFAFQTSDELSGTRTFDDKVKILINGNVGIGTTSPGYTLEIAGPSTTSFAYQRTGVSANKWGFHSDNDATYWQNLTSGNLLFTLQNGGNVGIGTTSPGQKLHINGNVRVGTDTGFIDFARPGGAIVGGIGWHTDDYFYVAGHPTAGTGAGNNVRVYAFGSLLSLGNPTAGDALTVAVNGNIGIGDTGPDQKLNVRDDGGSDTFRGIEVHNNSISQARAGICFKAYDWVQSAIWHGRGSSAAYNGALVLGTNPDTSDLTVAGVTGRMWILNSGNVGIATSSPSKKLEVAGSYKLGTNAYIQYDAGYPYTINMLNTAAVGNLILNAGAGSSGFESKIELQGSNTAGAAGITLSTGSSPRMVVTADGRVGIGNTNPQAALDISSSYSIQGGVYTYYYTGTAQGQSNINLDITVNNEGGGGNVFKIEAGFAHYYGMSYNSIGEWWCTSRGTNVVNTYILNAGSTNAGTWSSSKPTTSVLRITKSAGTYVGGGKYWVKVTYRPY